MKIKLLLFLLFINTTQSKAQIIATVINANDKKPIPYVNIWIEDENIGTSANELGKFEIGEPKDNHRLIFNALGFEIKTLKKEDIKDVIELTPKVYILNEVKVLPSSLKELKINSFMPEDIKNAFAQNTNNPWIVARYFPFDTIYNKTPFLKTLRTSVYSYTNKSTFNIRIYEANKDGTVGKEITKENILVTTKKGKFYPEVNVSKLNIQFPENGLFIGLEALIIDENKFESRTTKDDSYVIKTHYSPHFNNVIIKDNYFTWSYRKGKWEIVSKDYPENHMFKYSKLAIELTLTN
jgi:hypothetical protein